MTKPKRDDGSSGIFQCLSDVTLLMLNTFIFLFVCILVTARLSEENELVAAQKELEALHKQLNVSETDKERLRKNLQRIVVTDPEGQVDMILSAARVGRKDFDLFIKGLKDIPGKDVHLIVDASGSMHGVSDFLIPILRLIATRANKEISAITWFSDNIAKTTTGTMGDMFDKLMSGAPFSGNLENIGRAFRAAGRNAPPPGAYMLIGDEPSDDTIQYSQIPSPVFTLPFGRSDPGTAAEYDTLARKTGGKMLQMDFK